MAQASTGTLGKVIGNPVGEAAAFAAGLTIHPALHPLIQELTNATWNLYRSRPIDAMQVAEAVAHGHIDQETGATEAHLTGISSDRFEKLVEFFKSGPGASYAFELWRRGKIGETAFRRALKRSGLEDEWIDDLVEIKEDVLSPDVIATAIQRGVLNAPFDLPYDVNVGVGNVKPFPVSPIDAKAEAEAAGIDVEHLRVMTALVGLPMALDRAARAKFRQIITEADFLRAVLEGNARGEWAAAELEVAREILSSHDYTELELRGFSTRDQRLADTSKHGMSDEDSDKLYDVLGRAPSIHTLVVGLARGGQYPGSYANVPEPFRSAIQRSNIREEWAEVVYAARYNYPSGFQIRGEAKAGDLTTEQTKELLLEVGWAPKWAEFFSSAWAGAPAAKPAVSAQSAVSGAARAVGRAYTGANITKAKAEQDLTELGVAAAEQAPLFAAWDVQREAKLQGLSNTQIRNAYRKAAITEAEGLALLEAHGMTAAAAAAYLTA